MRKVIYSGKPVILGRHGRVNKGDTLFMREGEWFGVQDDPDFRLHKDSAVWEREYSGNPPKKTLQYDLRTVPWNSGRLDQALLRYTRPRLFAILAALVEHYGCRTLATYKDCSEDIVDAIMVHALSEGWHTLNRDEILSGGKILV